MNILDDLDRLASQSGSNTFDVALMLTFTANLPFFEALVLPRLERIGASRIAVFADRRGYASTLDSPILPEDCGRKYAFSFHGQRTSLQHAKILWLHGKRDVVWIGSHNLTASGYNDQREVSAKLESSDAGHQSALAECHAFISRLVAGCADVEHIWRGVPSPVADDNRPSDVRFLHSLDLSISDQLLGLIPSGGSLRVVSPFLDAAALSYLAAAINARQVVLDIPHEGLDVPIAGVVAAVPGLRVRQVPSTERLHAKAYVVSNEGQRSVVIGSANCTNAGVMRSEAQGGNVECVVVIPDGDLSDDVVFDEVNSLSDVPHTGRRTDEPMPTSGALHIDSATCVARVLTVAWHASRPVASVHIRVGDRNVPCSQSSVQVELQGGEPSMVALSGRVGDVWETVRRWVTFPERLNEFAVSRNIRRLRQYIGSDEPRSWSEGFDYAMGLLLGVLRKAEPERSRIGGGSDQTGRSRAATSDALEVLAYSRDPETIDATVAKLIIGDERTDILTAIRALLRRMTSATETEGEEASADSGRRIAQQYQAASRAVGRLVTHVRFLAESVAQLDDADEARARPFLALSFVAIALVWRHLRGAEETDTLQVGATKQIARSSERERFADAGIRAVTALSRSKQACTLIRDREVAGSFVLALSAFAEARAGEDPSELRKAASAILSGNPKVILADWMAAGTDIVEVLPNANLDSWATDALTLFGVPSARVQIRQEGKWGLFLQLVDLESRPSAQVTQLYKEAAAKYRGELIWEHYITVRGKATLLSTKQPICTTCRQRLPLTRERAFKVGDPVACRCGAILIFRE